MAYGRTQNRVARELENATADDVNLIEELEVKVEELEAELENVSGSLESAEEDIRDLEADLDRLKDEE